MNSFEKKLKIIRIVLLLIPFFVLGWLIQKNFVFSGQMEAAYNFDKNNPFISILTPAGRTLGVEKYVNSDYTQKIIVEPVYFDLYMPTKFNKANFTFIYKAPSGRSVRVGQQIFDSGWNYHFEDLNCEKIINSWCVGNINFDLSKAYIEDKKINFIISSPGLDVSGEDIELTQIKVVLSK
jgi:hypothetical protein